MNKSAAKSLSLYWSLRIDRFGLLVEIGEVEFAPPLLVRVDLLLALILESMLLVDDTVAVCGVFREA